MYTNDCYETEINPQWYLPAHLVKSLHYMEQNVWPERRLPESRRGAVRGGAGAGVFLGHFGRPGPFSSEKDCKHVMAPPLILLLFDLPLCSGETIHGMYIAAS